MHVRRSEPDHLAAAVMDGQAVLHNPSAQPKVDTARQAHFRAEPLAADALARTARASRSLRPRLAQPRAALNVLLLTSGLGSGHARTTKAVEQAWRASDPSVRVSSLDFWELMDAGVAEFIQQSYLRLASEQPELYDRVYHLDQGLWRSLLAGGPVPQPLRQVLQIFSSDALPLLRRSGLLDRSLTLALLAVLKGPSWGWIGAALRSTLLGLAYLRLTRRLGARIRSFAPDLIVVAEMWPAVLLSRLKTTGAVAVPAVGVLTDFGVHDLWVQQGLDHYCVGSADMVASLRAAGVEQARISVTGIPLMAGFQQPPSQESARQALGLDPQRPVVLLLGGGLGLGVEEAVALLATGAMDAQWLAVTGSNRAEFEHLTALAARTPSLKVHGWTEQMAHLMRAADVVVGKPGGLTVAEAMACGRPLLATHCLRGQEGFNVRFLEAHGVGRLVQGRELAASVAALLADRSQLAAMQERAAALGHCDSAQQVVSVARMLAPPKGTPAPSGSALGAPTRWMRRAALSCLRQVDALYRRWHALQPVGEMLYVGRTRYRGPVREFADGTRLAPGDWVGTLHFNNARIHELGAALGAQAAFRFARLLSESLHLLADLARHDPAFADLAAYHALTWLPPHGRQAGFITEPYPDGLRKRLRTAYFRLLVWTFAATEQTRTTARPDPIVYWLTQAQLLGKFSGVAQ